MIYSNKLLITFKSISACVAGIFLFQQVAWAGDLIDTTLERLNAQQTQMFAPSYLQNQQSVQETLVSQKQDIENFSITQAVASATTTTEETLPLKGPMSTGGASTPAKAQSSETILPMPVKDGVVPDFAMAYIEDPTVFVRAITKPDGTVYHYNEQGNISEIVYRSGRIIRYDDTGIISYARTEDLRQYYFDNIIGTNGVMEARLSKIIDESGTVYITYDNEGSIIISFDEGAGGLRGTYDSAGTLIKVDDHGTIVTKEYLDELNSTIVAPLQNRWSHARDEYWQVFAVFLNKMSAYDYWTDVCWGHHPLPDGISYQEAWGNRARAEDELNHARIADAAAFEIERAEDEAIDAELAKVWPSFNIFWKFPEKLSGNGSINEAPFIKVRYASDGAISEITNADCATITYEDCPQDGLVRQILDAAGDPSIPKPVIKIMSSIPDFTGQNVLSVDYSIDNKMASASFNLIEGGNALSFSETDSDGNIIDFAISEKVTLDTIAPTLGLISDAYVYDPAYQFSYHINDANIATSDVTENITLTRGFNTLTRQVQDKAGNTNQMTWNVFLDQNAERGLSYDYDVLGNLVRQTTFNGEDITFEYDANNRLAAIAYPEGTSVSLIYDDTGNVTRMTDLRGNTDYAYDIAGRLSSVTLPDGQRLDYTYDPAGYLTRFIYAGKTIYYGYDAVGRLTSVIDGTDITTYDYNAAGDLISTTLPNGICTSYTYDNAGNLTGIRHEKEGVLIADFTYTLNASGERIQMIETRPESTRTVNYTYDAFKRLVQESDSLNGVINYTYDNAGNRLSKEVIPLVIATQVPRIFIQYVYGTDNRLTSLTEKTYDASGLELSNRTENFVYDAAGNLRQHITPDKVYYYEFNSRNLLVRFSDGENETTYDYDGAGNRISKTVNGIKTSYLIDPTSSIPQVLAEMDPSGNVTKTYAFGLDRLSSASGGTAQYFLQDGLGSSIGLTGSNGEVSEGYSYDAFGNSYSQNASHNFLHTGEQRDAETGLIYLRARYYDPALGRFISRDPGYIGNQAETQSLNPFVYVQNDPVDYVDPLGIIPEEWRKLPHKGYGRYVGAQNEGPGDPIDFYDYSAYRHDKRLGISSTRNERILADLEFLYNISATDLIPCLKNFEYYKLPLYGEIHRRISQLVFGVGAMSDGIELAGGAIVNAYEKMDNAIFNDFGGFSEMVRLLAKAEKDDYISGNGPGGGGGSGLDGWSVDSGFGNYNYSLTGALGSSSPFDLGGVYMDKALSIIGENIQNIHGVSYDPLTGQIIMLSDTGATVPEIPVDYFLAALKAVFGNQSTAPGVSIDPVEDAVGNPDYSQDQNVRFLGGIENTALGKAVYEADLLMKLIGIGSDNITKTTIRPNGEDISESYISQHIPGFKDYFTLSSEVTDPSILTEARNLRCWFVPKDMKLVKSDDGDAFVFDNISVQLLTETTLLSSDSPEVIPDDPRAVAFVQFFNDHFAELAELYPEFRELEKGMRAVGLAKFIKDNNIPVDLDWISKANVTPVTTPTTTPVASATKTVTVNSVGQQATITLSGGVDYSLFDGKNFQYLLDTNSQASGLHDAAQVSRTGDTTQSWSVTMNGATYQASAFSLAPTKKDGNFSWAGTDLAYTTSGGMSLTWQRYYDSFEAGNKTDMGNGWSYTPYALHFPVAKETETFTLNGTTSSIAVYPKVYLSDKEAGGYILFDPMGIGTDGRVFYASEDQKIGSQALFLNTDGSYTLARDGNNINFTADGRLTTLVDKNQNIIEYVYDAAKKLIRIDDKSSTRSIAVTYGTDGKILKVTGADNRSVLYAYDPVKNNLIKVTQDWSGRFVDLSYDSDHRLLSAVDDTNRNLFSNTYDLLGRLTSQTNSIGTQVDSGLNLLTQDTEYTNMTSGANSSYAYDNMFRITNSTDALGSQTQYQYIGNSLNLQSVTNALGNSQSFEYDAYGNINSVTDSLGNKTKLYYQANGLGESRLIFVERPNGYGTFYEYDAQGNVIETAEGSRIKSIGDDGSIIVSVSNFKTNYAYDSKGRVTQTKDANGNITDYTYDDAGNVVQVKDGLQNAQATEYLTRNGVTTNLVSKATDALGRAVTFGYDTARDLVTSVATALGTTQYIYDSRDRQTEVIDAAGHKTQFIYDTKDQLTSVVDTGDLATTADDIISNFTYDALGQLVNIAGPLGAITKFAYDLAGRVVKIFIGEDAKDYALTGSIEISDVGEDTANLTFNVDSNVKQVEVFYKKKIDIVYQSFIITNPSVGDNQVTLDGLSGNTSYDFEIQYKDGEGDVSYSRKYDFKTKTPELPVILTTTVQAVTDTTASIEISISKEIKDAQIRYHVRGDTVNKVVYTQNISGADINGLTFNLENLRSGLDYDAEITITDRFGIASEIKAVSFKTTGVLSGNDTAIHATPRFGQVVATFTTQAYISIENDLLTNPFAETYSLTVRDTQGNIVSSIATQFATSSLLDRVIVLGGLTSNSEYTYTLVVTSRGDIPPVSGAFKTAPGGDTVASQPIVQLDFKDPFNLVLGITSIEDLKTLIVTLTDKVTQAIKKYYFFDIAANIAKLFLLDGLDAGRGYAIKWSVLDTSGNLVSSPFSMGFATPALDETPPAIIENIIVEKTDTTAKLHLTTSELLNKIRIRYRVVGTTDWSELMLIPPTLAFDIDLTNLLTGQAYEYQYILDDKSGNQLLTEWINI